MQQKKFYAALRMKGSEPIGHAISSSQTDIHEIFNKENLPAQKEDTSKSEKEYNFESIFLRFERSMRSYRMFIPKTVLIAPSLVKSYAEQHIANFIEKNGKEIERREDIRIFEIDYSLLRSLRDRNENLIAAQEGARQLPIITFIGLVSIFDAFIYSLIKTIGDKKPDIIISNDKNFNLKDILSFSSINEMLEYFIDSEINMILRSSHIDQIKFLSDKLGLNFTFNERIWSEFAEICERRNLFVHTGGIVSDIYIKNCKKYNKSTDAVKVGDKLKVNRSYFENAVSVFQQVGAKLCYIIWRKLERELSEDIDSKFNELAFNLIKDKEYKTAIELLVFSKSVPKISDLNRRMMVINLANAHRLLEEKDKAKDIISEFDWSASDVVFRVCVNSVLENIEEMIDLMPLAKSSISPNDYRDWPVFIGNTSGDKFQDKFKQIYEEDFIVINDSSSETD